MVFKTSRTWHFARFRGPNPALCIRYSTFFI
jgi:hypothetical protein